MESFLGEVAVMWIVSKELTVYDIKNQGSKAFGRAKKVILNNANLKSDFALTCQCQQHRNPSLQTSYTLSLEVYEMSSTKFVMLVSTR